MDNMNQEFLSSPRSTSIFNDLERFIAESSFNFNQTELNFDPTPRKRPFELVAGGNDEPINSKKQHLEVLSKIRMKIAPKNECYNKCLNIGFAKNNSGKRIFSCFIGDCRFKTYEVERFENHLNYSHNEDSKTAKGVCGICNTFVSETTIFDEFLHVFEHTCGFPREEAEENEIIPLEPIIKQEPIEEDLDMTVMLPDVDDLVPAQSDESDLLVEVVPIHRKPVQRRKRTKTTAVTSSKRVLRGKKQNEECLSETMCLEIISKKISDSKSSGRGGSSRPNKSISELFKESSESANESVLQPVFISIEDLYPWISEKVTSAIFKLQSSVDVQLSESSLFSTFKCMNELCHFFTTDFEVFKKHTKRHDSAHNYCSYCLQDFDKPLDLFNHLEGIHKFDRFQCNKCMFRSCQKGFVDIHQRVYHKKDAGCEVLKSPVQKLMKSDRSKCQTELQKKREKFVSAFKCKTPKCKEVFYIKENFKQHLEMELNRPIFEDFKTFINQQISTLSSSETDGIFQCLYCIFGTDDSNVALDHIALNHPHNFAYVCKRARPQRLIELNIPSTKETVENSTIVEYIGVTTTDAKTFEGDLGMLNSTEEEEQNSAKQNGSGLVVSKVFSIN